jgi:hypothetical protein
MCVIPSPERAIARARKWGERGMGESVVEVSGNGNGFVLKIQFFEA